MSPTVECSISWLENLVAEMETLYDGKNRGATAALHQDLRDAMWCQCGCEARHEKRETSV